MHELLEALGAIAGAVAMGIECLLWGGVDLSRRVLNLRYLYSVLALGIIAILTVPGTILLGFATQSQTCFLVGGIAFIAWATVFAVAALPAFLFVGSVKEIAAIIFKKKVPAAPPAGKKK